MRVNVNMIKFAPMQFFKLNFKAVPQSLEFYIKQNRIKAGEVLREVRNCMFDSQYEIHSMIAIESKRIKEINRHRKQAQSFQSKAIKEEQMSDQFVSEMSQFQILLNMLYERSVRTCFEQSVQSFIDSLRDITHFISDSIQKDISTIEITEADVLHLATDPVLAKRMEKKFSLKLSVTFNKETEEVGLDPPVMQFLKEIENLILHD